MTNHAQEEAAPVAGLYETLITRRLEERMKHLDAAGWRAIDDAVGVESAPHVLSRHIALTVRRVLQGLQPAEQVVAANHILESLNTIEGATEWVDLVTEGPRQLLAVAEREAPGVYAIRPHTPCPTPLCSPTHPTTQAWALSFGRNWPQRTAWICSAPL